LLLLCLAAEPAEADRTYTLDDDFDEGALINLNHDSPNNDQLQLTSPPSTFPFINVAASARGTVVRINTDTGEIVGEYQTAPTGRGLDPSRTTVDLFGNVWTGNRGEQGLIAGIQNGSIVKIGLVTGGVRANADGVPNPSGDYLAPPFSYNTCVDRDADGLVKTSRGLGDIRSWPDITDGAGGVTGIVEDADDECILVYQRLPEAPQVRHVSVDAANDVWVEGSSIATAFSGQRVSQREGCFDTILRLAPGRVFQSASPTDSGLIVSASCGTACGPQTRSRRSRPLERSRRGSQGALVDPQVEGSL
jgi:hypothetical protein